MSFVNISYIFFRLLFAKYSNSRYLRRSTSLLFILMQQFLMAELLFCVYDEWRTRCKSRDIYPDIPVWLKNGVSSHSYTGHYGQ